MRTTHLHSLNQPSLVLVILLCVFSLCLFTVNTPAQTPGEIKDKGAQQENASQQEEYSPRRAEQRAQAVVGSWLGTLGDGTKILTTFNADGTLINSVQGGISTDPTHFTHTLHHGVWRHLGGRRFGLTMWDIIYDVNTGELKLYTKIRAVLTLSGTEDEGSAKAKVEFITPQGDVAGSFLGDFSYKRIKFEPLD